MTHYTKYIITAKKTGNKMTVEEFAIMKSKEGEHIVYCDIECVARNGDDYYVLDECGNYVWIDSKLYDVKVKK